MSASSRNIYTRIRNDGRMLASHGFDSWPDAEELTRHLCDLEDGLLTVADAVGVALAKDAYGNWRALRRMDEGGERRG